MDLQAILPASRIAAMRASGQWLDRLITDYLDEAAAAAPDKPAVTDYNGETGVSTTLSYAELDRLSRRVALALLDLGIRPGDVVAYQLPNWWQFSVITLACIRIGAITNPLMPIFRARELRYMLGFAEAKLLIAPAVFRDFDHAAMIDGLRADLPALQYVFHIGDGGDQAFEPVFIDRDRETAADAAARLAAARPDPNAVAQLLYTSGTTGEPKGVMHTHNTLISILGPMCRTLGLDADDVVWMPSPMAHQTGYLHSVWLPLTLGASVVIQDRWDPRRGAGIVQRHRASFVLAATPFLADLVDLPDRADFDLTSLRCFVSAGAPIPSALVRRARDDAGIGVLSGWGMSENGLLTVCSPEDPPDRSATSDGRAVACAEVIVVDDRNRVVPPNTEGFLKAKSASMFVGYLKKPGLYGMDADGWLDTGDRARMDADGYIRITGRAKDIVIRGGENVPVIEVEDLLYKHPAVAEVAIVGMPDARLGERACAFLVPKPGADVTLPALTQFLLDQGTAKAYLPERLELRHELPRTPSGKIQKFKLREEAKGFAR